MMPLDELQAEAADRVTACTELGIPVSLDKQAALAQALLDWFKGRFFSWVRSAGEAVAVQACAT